MNNILNSSLETLMLYCEYKEEPSRKRRHHRKRYRPKTPDDNSLDSDKSPKTRTNHLVKHISQESHDQNQNFQCISDFNTNVCQHESKQKKSDKKYRSNSSESKNKNKHNSTCASPICDVNTKHDIVPQCLRKSCQVQRLYECKKRWLKAKYDRLNGSKCTNRSYYANQGMTRYESNHRNSHRHSGYAHKKKRHDTRLPSPKSPPSFKDDLTYEDISSTSLDFYDEVPMSYRRHFCRHLRNRNKRESKLDTLIKRTKERERLLVEQSRSYQKSLYTSTPLINENSSSDNAFTFSDMDMSLNSRSTLVLESLRKSYQASSIEDLSSKTDGLSNRAYSPSSPTKDEECLFKLSDSDYEIRNVKSEPTVDSAMYSLISSPDDLTQYESHCLKKKRLKKELVKPESLSPKINISLEDSNCSVKNVKIESDKY